MLYTSTSLCEFKMSVTKRKVDVICHMQYYSAVDYFDIVMPNILLRATLLSFSTVGRMLYEKNLSTVWRNMVSVQFAKAITFLSFKSKTIECLQIPCVCNVSSLPQ